MQQRVVKDSIFFAPAIFCPPLCFLHVSYLYWTYSRLPHLAHIMGLLASQRNPIKASPVMVTAASLVPSVLLFSPSQATASFASFQGFFSLSPLSMQEL